MALQSEEIVVETALTVAHRAMVWMHGLRLDVSAGKLDVCNLACTHEGKVGCKNHRIPRRRNRLGKARGVNVVPTGNKCRCDNEMNKKKIRGPFWNQKAVCGSSSRFTQETA